MRVLLTTSQFTSALQSDLQSFSRLTGATVYLALESEAGYLERVSTEFVSGSPNIDVVMVTPQMVWEYGAPGWLEDLDPWLANNSATAADYDVDDLPSQLQDATRWSFVTDDPVGRGGRWAMPWGVDPLAMVCDRERLRRLGLSAPATLAELDQTVREAAEAASGDQYGLAVRAAPGWASIGAAFMTQYHRAGNRDFSRLGGVLTPAMSTTRSVAFHRQWAQMVRSAGAPRWQDTTQEMCARDMGAGHAAIAYDTSSHLLATDRPGVSARAGGLTWHPPPRGTTADGSIDLALWSLAINARSSRKPAAWLFLQWATGRAHLRRAALSFHTDSVRTSVVTDPQYRRALGTHRGFLEVAALHRTSSRILTTPQLRPLGTLERWAQSVQRIAEGEDATSQLDVLDAELQAKL